jgi:hypothetical protein
LTVSFAYTPLPVERVPPTLPDASGFTEWAVPIVLWAFATVEPIVKTTTSDSAEIERRPNVPMFFLIALLPTNRQSHNPKLWMENVMADTFGLKK